MSKENYRRLGDYIREVDVRNRDLEVKELLGVSVSKEFIPSIASTSRRLQIQKWILLTRFHLKYLIAGVG